ncbi:hypothetical protein [[Muricauda] lutisoli]|uniref:Collagen-like protein n=1 Tax=[Muricauda] lutisoli TaxID=2816035 RepID=A0ABS3EZA8_9FLAO|nr:hypothetical protein [[Muricauda] lutisoli]MBO0331578.1 hypothetical protein [[Muricauda] lutisoli]
MKTTPLNLWKLVFYLLMGLTITLTSCSGKDGADGESIKGDQGPAGIDGNANVITSNWKQIQWSDPVPSEGNMYLDVPEVNLAEFVETGGLVMMYFQVTSTESVVTYALPFMYKTASLSFYTQTTDVADNIVLNMKDPDEQSIYDVQNTESFKIRYVLVPANVADQTGLADNIPPTFEDAKFLLGID